MVEGSGVYVRFPLPDERLFRNRAIEDVLALYLHDPAAAHSVTDLREITGHGGDTIQTAIEVLEAADLLETRTEGRRRLVAANRARFNRPDAALLRIPQEAFRRPVAAFLDAVDAADVAVAGVVVFGSVAWGDADRASDVDVLVVVDDDLPEARRRLHDVRQRVEDETFDGDRYAFQLLVESVDSARERGAELREILRDGVVLRSNEPFAEVEAVVLDGGE